VTTARLSPPGPEEPTRFTPAQVDAFAARARAEAECRPTVGDPGEVAAAARRYAERLVVHATFSVAEVADLLLDDGDFTVERLDEHHVGGALGAGSGPATNQPATHLQIVARRRCFPPAESVDCGPGRRQRPPC